MRALTIAVVFLSGATLVAAGFEQSPECRTFSAEETRTITGASGGNIYQACRFDLPTTSRICSVRTQSNITNFSVTFTDKYNSVDDFIDEVKVIPPISRIQTQARQYTSGKGTDGQIKYEYDNQRRQTRLTSSMGGNLLVTTYTSWDPKGRPTVATVSSMASTINLQYKYDDTLRTMTIAGPAGIEVDTYDADGKMIKEETQDGMGRTYYAIKITKTDKVCKGGKS